MSLDKKSCKSIWLRLFESALDADRWGQSLEAAEAYEIVAERLARDIPHLTLSMDERSLLMKIKHSVELRQRTLTGDSATPSLQSFQQLSFEQMKRLQQPFEQLFVNSVIQPFPLHLRDFSVALTLPKQSPSAMSRDTDDERVMHAEESDSEEFRDEEIYAEKRSSLLQKIKSPLKAAMSPTAAGQLNEAGTLLPAPKVSTGSITLTLYIDQIGLKDAQSYISPHCVISVQSKSGQIIESQQTPVSRVSRAMYVEFHQSAQLQTTLAQLKRSSDYAVFIEFRHYKPSKKKVSTRCFAVLEVNEIVKLSEQQDSEANKNRIDTCLELYKKPLDPQRKRLKLFTVKKLYAHIGITFNKH